MTTLQAVSGIEAEELLKSLPKFRIAPINGWVLLKKIIREETKTQGGVMLAAEQRSSKGVVIAVAETDERGNKIPLAPGDLVIFTNFPISLEDLDSLTQEKNLFLVRYEEVYARLIAEGEPRLQELCT